MIITRYSHEITTLILREIDNTYFKENSKVLLTFSAQPDFLDFINNYMVEYHNIIFTTKYLSYQSALFLLRYTNVSTLICRKSFESFQQNISVNIKLELSQKAKNKENDLEKKYAPENYATRVLPNTPDHRLNLHHEIRN